MSTNASDQGQSLYITSILHLDKVVLNYGSNDPVYNAIQDNNGHTGHYRTYDLEVSVNHAVVNGSAYLLSGEYPESYSLSKRVAEDMRLIETTDKLQSLAPMTCLYNCNGHIQIIDFGYLEMMKGRWP